MVTQEKIQEWKKIYGKVMKQEIMGIDYYYRPIVLDEYLNIQRLIEADPNAKIEVNVVKTAVLSPDLPDVPPAGLVLNLSDKILEISGFNITSKPVEL